MTDAIEVRDLRKTYGRGPRATEALKGVSLDVPTGSIFGLLGPNGAGKSTFINILAGLVVKTSGSVRIWGFDIDRNPRMARASIGVVPQELNLDAFFTPLESLESQAGLYGVPKRERRSMEILEAVGLADKAHAYARSLSGGMKRRLLVAKALAHHPAVLVLDEPTAGVDIELRRTLWAYVRRLNASGVTIILTTHYLEEAQEMCDRIAIIDQGAVVACDATSALIGSLDSKTLIIRPAEPVPEVPASLRGLATLRADGGLALRYSRLAGDPIGLIEQVRAAGVIVRDVATEEPDLEDVFLALTSRHGGGVTRGRDPL
ncbi:MAG: ABC transporter ATP-binding protein [Rhodobacteraceae bacterium]|nr:MAG: ABC transporter ATP-binding protein [Paracoccaceae bacterium]